MLITLNVLRCPDAVVPESRRSSGGDIAIGRGTESDWALSDPDRVLSKRHCVLEYRGGGWQVRDTSTNGTFVNHAQAPVGRGQVVPLSDGDRLRLGAYEIEVRVQAPTGPAFPPPQQTSGWGLSAPETSFRHPIASPSGFESGPFQAASLPRAGGLPEDWDPFADDAPVTDRHPAIAESFRAPGVTPLARLPDDWDIDTAPTAPPGPRTMPDVVPPVLASGGLPENWDPLGDDDQSPNPPVTPPHLATPAATPAPLAPAILRPEPVQRPVVVAPYAPPSATVAPGSVPAASYDDPFAEPDIPARVIHSTPPPVAAVVSPTAPPAAIESAEALAALLRGIGLPASALHAADPNAVLESAGLALRAAVSGLRALLIARADVKREFRIEQTMLRSAGNNPLKFAATDEAATVALLAGRSGPKAVAETVDDLTAHQVASLAATQAAARALMERLAPEGLEAADSGGGMFGAREKRLWEAYRRLHAQVTDQFEDDFDSAFGKEFARAYERASRPEER